MDVHVSFWNKLQELSERGLIRSSDKVKEELLRGKDELNDWIKNLPKEFFIPLDDSIMTKYSEAQMWVFGNTRYTQAAHDEFARVADAYLIATAAATGSVVVTFEKSNIESKRRVMIPDVCNALNVRCCDLNTMFRQLNVKI